MNHRILTQELVHRRFDYNSNTGALVWKERLRSEFGTDRACSTWNTRYSGHIAGHVSTDGYRKITLFGQPWGAHQIIWLHVHGVMPTQVDHQDGIRDNNKLSNLVASRALENCKNQKRSVLNTSGVTGVGWDRRRKCWRAQIRVDYVMKFLGYSATKEVLIARRKAAEIQYGFHPNHGRIVL